MDDAFGVIVVIAFFVLGGVISHSVTIASVNEHCNNYKQYDTKEYKLTCVKK